MNNNKELSFRCYVVKKKSQWVAICIDLCLASQANTEQEAISKLHSMILSYVNDAFGKHKEFAQQLLNRKAPFSQLVFYYQMLFLKYFQSIFLKNKMDSNKKVFEEHCSVFQ